MKTLQLPDPFNERDIFQKTEKYLQEIQIPRVKTKEEAWKEFLLLINNQLHVQNRKNHSLRTQFLAAAASMALIIITTLVALLLNQTEYQCIAGSRKSILLPDSSVVELNAGTTIEYNKLLWILRS